MRHFLRTLAGVVAIIVIVLPVVAVLKGWVGSERFALRKLRIDGQLAADDAARVRATIAPMVQKGFFASDLGAAQAALSKLPFVAHAEVRKRWPDTVDVRIEVQRPFAFWGKDRLVSDKGALFARSPGMALPQGMPQLDGDERNVPAVLDLYAKSSELFAAAGLRVKALRADHRGSWSLDLADGTQVLVGRNDAEARIARFARLMPRLVAQHGGPLKRADLRYTNGFALTWTNAAAPAPAAPGAKPTAPATTPPPAPATPLPQPLPEPIAHVRRAPFATIPAGTLT